MGDREGSKLGDACGGKGWTAYIDLFGLKAYLADNILDDTLVRLAALVDAIEGKSQHNSNSASSSIATTFFGDSIVLTTPAGAGDVSAFRRLIEKILAISRHTYRQGFACRGAIAYDNLSEDSRITISRAYLKAYNIESGKLIYPVIIVPESELSNAGIVDYYRDSLSKLQSKGDSTLSALILNNADLSDAIATADRNITLLSANVNRDESYARRMKLWTDISEMLTKLKGPPQ